MSRDDVDEVGDLIDEHGWGPVMTTLFHIAEGERHSGPDAGEAGPHYAKMTSILHKAAMTADKLDEVLDNEDDEDDSDDEDDDDEDDTEE